MINSLNLCCMQSCFAYVNRGDNVISRPISPGALFDYTEVTGDLKQLPDKWKW